MSAGRVLSACAASLAVAGCAVVALGMGRAASAPDADSGRIAPVVATRTARPAYLPATPATSTPGSSSAPTPSRSSSPPPATSRHASGSAAIVTSSSAARPAPAPRPVRYPTTRTTTSTPKPAPTAATTSSGGQSLPLRYSTGSATRVITVVASSSRSTTATLQAWTKAAGGGWKRYGSAVTAHVGSDGLGNASEYRSATPTGSFTLTQAFGHYSNPGTSLPYVHTTPADWWISQSGPLYNTRQHCSAGCSFTRGDPNEHLYYETPYYNYAVVIDYNTRNAPGGVQAGKGSAFFLHVAYGGATAGCISISQSKLVSIMRWLAPSAHPRILIGVT